jgi:uncharacterized protein (TIGR02246 family)
MRFVTLAALAGLAIGCTPREGAMEMGMGTVDTAAAMAGIDSLKTRYSQLEMAGDAAALAQLFTEDATLDLYGVPRTKGRAAIQAALAQDFGMRKYTVSEINPINTNVRTNETATQIGTYHAMHDVNGTADHEWGRFVVGMNKGTDGMWRLNFLMAFPDSTKADK